ncbi:MAG TPA: addiction module protein [Rudaea sp.]|nr:addiction module protein [Rudaea sp.]
MAALDVEISKLSVAERILLVEDLWDGIVSEAPESVGLTPEQRLEVERRLREHDADPSTAHTWESVRAELFKRTA